MAIEIRELVIRVTLHDDNPAHQASGATQVTPPSLTAETLQWLRQDVTQECVRQVLAELQRQRER